MGQLDGRVAIVTGSGRGIGHGIARAFALEGAAVAVCDRDGPAALAVADDLLRAGGRAVPIAVDVTDPEQVSAMVATVLAELGGLHVLVNNAGIDTVSTIVEMSLETWKTMIDTDLTSVFLCSKASVPTMIEQRFGRVINIGSQLALKGTAARAHYCAAKAGVHGFTRALAHELAPFGVTVNVIAPGPIETDLLRGLPADWVAGKKREIPLGRFGTVEEVAPTAVLLASDGGAYYTGSTLNVSGGDVML